MLKTANIIDSAENAMRNKSYVVDIDAKFGTLASE